MIIKKFLIMGLVASCSLSSVAMAQGEVEYTHAERMVLMNRLPDLVQPEFFSKDKVMADCWEAAKRGDDTSLYAVYVMAESYPIMIKYQEGMNEVLSAGKSDTQKYETLKSNVLDLDPQRALYYLNKVPGAMMHCAEISGFDMSDEKAYLGQKIRKELDL